MRCKPVFNSVDFNCFYPQLKYSGGACDDANIGYFIGFSVVFFFVSAVSATQLVCNKYCRKLGSCTG